MPRFTRTHPAPQVPKRRGGDYARYRSYVRADFERCCAYCISHEEWLGGPDFFDLDHFRPVALFKELEDDYANLYYACKACNGKTSKSNHWPTDEQIANGIEFVDLCLDEVDKHYCVEPDGILEGRTPAGCYTIDMLRLNRVHLVELRAWLIQRDWYLDKPRP